MNKKSVILWNGIVERRYIKKGVALLRLSGQVHLGGED